MIILPTIPCQERVESKICNFLVQKQQQQQQQITQQCHGGLDGRKGLGKW